MAYIWTETDDVSAVNLNKSIQALYPVGSIYINASDNTNPATLFGFGTWERFGEGRVLVSQDSTDTNFDVPGKTGGEKTHQLTESEMPSHTHSFYVSESDSPGATRPSGGTGTVGTQTTSSAGNDQPHNNLQPYITVYIWVRTA